MTGKLYENLLWMKERGSSVILNWGEDNDLWECSWITSGERFVGFSRQPDAAVLKAIEAARVAKERRREDR